MKQLLYTMSFISMIWTTILNAEVHIEIVQGATTARPIAIIPFHWNCRNSMLEDIGNIIATDLRNSGRFNPLKRSLFPQQPINIQEIKADYWSSIGIDTIVIGQVNSNSDNSYNVTYQLIDIKGTEKNILAQNSYKVNEKWLRYAGHTTSDEIFKKLTGIQGAFRTRIAYVVQTNSYFLPYELRISDYDGYNQFVIHRSPQLLMSPTWSPDGSKLAYVTFEHGGHSTLVIHTLTSGEIHQIASFPRHNGAPSFSPDGTKLAFALSKTGSLNIYVMDLFSGHIRQVTDSRSNNTEPTWFPDNQHLAFTSDQSGRPQIYKININTGTMQRITWKGSQNQNANVSRDGKFMVMVNLTNGQQHIAKQDLITGNVEILSSTLLDETPSISPNGIMVIYSSSNERKRILNLISMDGQFKAYLPTTDGQVTFPTWSPYL